MTAPRDPDATPRAPRLGDSTRAIRAASRTPEVLQRPTSIPIFQTATFTSADAESLAAVVGDAFAPGVEVTEIEQVKGLEFDYVILVEASAAHFPDTAAARGRAALERPAVLAGRPRAHAE